MLNLQGRISVKRLIPLCLLLGVVLQAGCQEVSKISGSRPVPVRAAIRHSLVNDTLVVVLINEAPHQLAVDVGLKRNGQVLVVATVSLPANGTKEVGWMEGFPFQRGDTVVLSHPEYTAREMHIPPAPNAAPSPTKAEGEKKSP